MTRAIVTGAASGIGRAVAEILAREGASLVITDREASGLQNVERQLGGAGGVVSMAGDLSDPALPEVLVTACVDRFGGIDAIVSNAGAVTGAPLLDLKLEHYELLFHVNTRPTWLLGKAAHAHLKASGGSIVATASMSAEHPTPPLGSYAASKAALLMLIRQMALEWGPDGIRANCVSPGVTLTGINAAGYSDPERLARRKSTIPLRRIASPNDIAQAAMFLIGPGARQITGHNLVVDGGLSSALMSLCGAGTGLGTDD